MRTLVFSLLLAASVTTLAVGPGGAARLPDGCQGVATGTSTCFFSCDYDDVTGTGQLITVTFVGDTGAGGRVTASCGGASASCTAGPAHACVDTSGQVAVDDAMGTCTGTGTGVFTCQTS